MLLVQIFSVKSSILWSGMVAHECDPRTCKLGTGGSKVQSHLVESQINLGCRTLPLLNKKWKKEKKKKNNDYCFKKEREFSQWCHQWWLLKCRQQAWWWSSTFCAMKRLCLGELSRASVCSVGGSHRTVGKILKAEWFLWFSWKSSKTMPSAIEPMTFFF